VRAALFLVSLLVPLSPWGSVEGQAPATLDAVERLMEERRFPQARSALEGWWDARSGRANRDEMQRALYLRARLNLDGEQAELDYRRLSIEYPGGRYSDEALLRVAQAAHSRGDPAEAAERLRQLLRDYPASPHRLEAGNWLDRHGETAAAAVRERVAGGPSASPPAPSAPDHLQAPSPPPPSPSPAPMGAGADPGAATPFAVQMGAFAGVEGARFLQSRVSAAGYDARLVRVPGSELLRVRVGRFPSESEARELLESLRSRGFDATISQDAHRETPFGG